MVAWFVAPLGCFAPPFSDATPSLPRLDEPHVVLFQNETASNGSDEGVPQVRVQ